MPREISRRTSGPPETKGKVSRPDVPGKRDLPEHIVEDRPDPTIVETHLGVVYARGGEVEVSEISDPCNFIPIKWMSKEEMEEKYPRDNEAIQRGQDMDQYVGSINPTEGKSGGKNAKSK